MIFYKLELYNILDYFHLLPVQKFPQANGVSFSIFPNLRKMLDVNVLLLPAMVEKLGSSELVATEDTGLWSI